jgi:leucyl-tRNA synthetase
MFMGPLDQDRPWETRSVTGSMRLLQRVWRNLIDEDSGEMAVAEAEPSEELLRVLHRTIDAVSSDMANLRFNTAIARITELNNEVTKLEGPTPRVVADPLVLMLAPLVPHIAEELWQRMGHEDSIVYAAFPEADPAYLVEDTIELPVHVNGKMRSSVTVAADASEEAIKEAALADAKVIERMAGKDVRKLIVVPGRLVNIVV